MKLGVVGLWLLSLITGLGAVANANTGAALRKRPTSHAAALSAPKASASKVQNLIRVPLVRQGTDYTCGVAATQSVVYFYDPTEDYNEEDLAKDLRSNRRDGTVSHDIVRFVTARGFHVTRKTNMSLDELKGYIDQGKPVILLIQAWSETEDPDWENEWDDGHFVVANGYDADNVYFMDPSTTGTYTYIPIPEFLKRWHDVDGKTRVRNFGMVIWKDTVGFDADAITPIL